MTDRDEAGESPRGEETPAGERPTVLVVDDDESLADLLASWLASEYEVLRATSGSEALSYVTDDVDVVLLDRRMPGLSGDEVLAKINERNVDVRVVVITGVTPDVDIVEMPFDDYLVKPVTRAEVTGAVEAVLKRDAVDDRTQEAFALAAKKAALEATLSPSERERSEEYQRLAQRLEEVESEIERTHTDLVREGHRAVIFSDVLDE
jgi:DNA-binding response OmpR family regulator